MIKECDICGHNFKETKIVEFFDDVLWACYGCIFMKPDEIGELLTECIDL